MTQETSQTAQHAIRAWFNGDIDKCLDHLSQPFGLNIDFGIDQAEASIENSKKATNSAAITPHPTSPQLKETFEKLIMDQDYACLHNLLISYFLVHGSSMPIKTADLISILQSSMVNSIPMNSKIETLPWHQRNINQKPVAPSKLSPNAFTQDSIESQLAALGPFHFISFYNLVVVHIIKGQLRQALHICDELVDYSMPFLVSTFNTFAVKLGLLFLCLISKMNFLQHPKQIQVLIDMDKVLSTKIQAGNQLQNPSSFSEIDALLEQNVWMHILRSQLSLSMSKIKSSKREVSQMMASFSAWESHRSSKESSSNSNNGNGIEKISSSNTSNSINNFNNNSSNDIKYAHAAIQFLKSKLLDMRHNQDKATSDLKELASLQSTFPAPFYNNLGILAFHRQKYAVASLYFLKASQENQKSKTQSIQISQNPNDPRRHLQQYSYNDIAPDIAYNMGLQMIMLGNFEGALKCFQDVTQKFVPASNVSLFMAYLRLAECQAAIYCNSINSSQHLTSFSESSSSSILASPTSGNIFPSNSASNPLSTSPSSSSLFLSTPSNIYNKSDISPSHSSLTVNIPPGSPTNDSNPSIFIQSSATPPFSGTFSSSTSSRNERQLKNAYSSATMALILFERYGKSGFYPLQAHKFGLKDALPLEKPPLTQRDFLFKIYLHVLIAWISMEMEEFVIARENLISADQAKNEADSYFAASPNLSSQQVTATEKTQMDHYIFIMYLLRAEAEVRLGNLEEAIKTLIETPAQLCSYPLNQYHVSIPSNNNSSLPSSVSNPANLPAKVVICCNLAAAHIVKGDFAQAQKLLAPLLSQKPAVHTASLLNSFLELRKGNGSPASIFSHLSNLQILHS